MMKMLNLLRDNFLLVIACFLLVFIPLYPKVPLFDIIPGYIVRVRLEDLLVLLAFAYYLWQIYRKKITWQTPLTKWIFAYLVVASLSILSATFLIKTIPLELIHLGKSVLHLFRYSEYFVLFFIFFSAVKKKQDLRIVFVSLIAAVLLVSFYGYGQKFWYWPVFSTMNREFSKGMVLYLTEHARVQSTFGGHYDLAAWLVIVLPLLYFATMIKKLSKGQRFALHLTHLAGLWLLITSASRASFIAYIASMFFGVVLLSAIKNNWRSKLWFITQKSLGFLLVLSLMTYTFGDDMRERLEHVLRAYPNLYQPYEQTQKIVEHQISVLKDPFKWVREWQERSKPKNGIAFDNTQLDSVLTMTDQQPVSTRPIDVYVDVPDQVAVVTTDSEGNDTTTYVEKERTWSDNALKYGLSFAIRLDELWPNAINGFKRNPLLGSGFATLNKKEFYQFTEAESTDNNFLRTLGETGLLGVITFYGAILSLLVFLYRNQKQHRQEILMIANLSFIAASVGLLLNASYIDVFASSKVAFTYWALAGALLAYNLHVKSAQIK